MDMSKNQEYAANYAEFAMEQMRRYGIPASVTLAQGILESSNGQSGWQRTKTTISVSRLLPHGLPEGAGTGFIPMTVRTKSSAAMTASVIPTSTIHVS